VKVTFPAQPVAIVVDPTRLGLAPLVPVIVAGPLTVYTPDIPSFQPPARQDRIIVVIGDPLNVPVHVWLPAEYVSVLD
jgi:hypothetical protein